MSLARVHDAILAHLEARFGERLVHVGPYAPDPSEALTTPAALFEIEGWDEDDDDGTGRLCLRLRCAVHCILSLRTPNVAREVRAFAAEVHALFAAGPIPGLEGVAGRIEAAGCVPGEFRPGQDGYEDMVVAFELPVVLGGSVWEGEGVVPTRVFAGVAPEIGPPHIDDYEEITG